MFFIQGLLYTFLAIFVIILVMCADDRRFLGIVSCKLGRTLKDRELLDLMPIEPTSIRAALLFKELSTIEKQYTIIEKSIIAGLLGFFRGRIGMVYQEIDEIHQDILSSIDTRYNSLIEKVEIRL